MRLIDEADARRRIVAFATGIHSTVLPVDTVMMLLTQVPAVDAVPVVRCRECRWWHEDDDIGHCDNPDGLDNYANPDDFCSYGERKEGADNA